MKRELVCITCPMGCPLVVELTDDGKEIISITGNTCPRGAVYAEAECTHPERVITSTVMCSDGGVIPVKTNGAIPKDKIFDCMKAINQVKQDLPISAGDVIIENIFGMGVDVIAVANRKA